MIYLDHAATSLPRRASAVAKVAEAAEWANPGRGQHGAQHQSLDKIEAAREEVRKLVGFGVVCFTPGATWALNQAIGGWRPVPEIVAQGPMLHNACRRPLLQLGARVWTLPHTSDGRIDIAKAREHWVSGTSLVVVSHASNINGILQPVAELAELAHQRNAGVIVDCAQTAGIQVPLDVGEADVVAFSAHKGLRALPGAGALVIREQVELEPLVRGGTGHDSLAVDVPEYAPERFESGTLNTVGIAAMHAAAREALEHPWAYAESREALVAAVEGAGLLCAKGELPIVSFNVPGKSALELEETLDRVFGIVVRAGLHCAPGAHATLGTRDNGAVRASTGSTTSPGELVAFGEALRQLMTLSA